MSCIKPCKQTLRGDIDGLMQERRNSIANALELRLSCNTSSICSGDACYAPTWCCCIKELDPHWFKSMGQYKKDVTPVR